METLHFMRMGFLSIDLPNVGTVSNTEAYFGEIISGVKLIRSYKIFQHFYFISTTSK